MLRRLSRKSRTDSPEVTVYTPEPKYAVQTDEERRRSSSSPEKITQQQQPSSGEIVRGHDETSMTLEEIKLKRKVSVSQSGKVHRKSTRNSIVDIFGDKSVHHCDTIPPPPSESEVSRQSRNTSDLPQYYSLEQRF